MVYILYINTVQSEKQNDLQYKTNLCISLLKMQKKKKKHTMSQILHILVQNGLVFMR